VCDLVGDQPLAVAPLRIVGTVAEEHVLADRERSGAESVGGGVGVGPGVDADASEPGTECGLESWSQCVIERCTATACSHHKLSRLRINLGTLGASHHCRR
jgi:hypothetical protein